MYEFSLDGQLDSREIDCPRCGALHTLTTGFVLNYGDAFAIYFAEPHEAAGEAFLEVVFGDFSGLPDSERWMFACRYGVVEGQPEPACSLVTSMRAESASTGTHLTRDSALAHPRLEDFWAVVDWALLNDPALHRLRHHRVDRRR